MHKHALKTAACIAHDLALATAYGGAVFAKRAFAPAVKEIKNENERVQVVETTGAKWSAINVPAHLIFATTWLVGRAHIKSHSSSRKVRKLVAVKDALVAGALVTGVVKTLAGKRLVEELPKGAPTKGGGEAPRSSSEIEKLERFLKVVAPVNAALIGGAIAMEPIIGEAVVRRVSLRRMFARMFR